MAIATPPPAPSRARQPRGTECTPELLPEAANRGPKTGTHAPARVAPWAEATDTGASRPEVDGMPHPSWGASPGTFGARRAPAAARVELVPSTPPERGAPELVRVQPVAWEPWHECCARGPADGRSRGSLCYQAWSRGHHGGAWNSCGDPCVSKRYVLAGCARAAGLWASNALVRPKRTVQAQAQQPAQLVRAHRAPQQPAVLPHR